MEEVELIAAPQQQTLSSLSPTAWGWLAVFSAIVVMGLAAIVRSVITRRRRRLVS